MEATSAPVSPQYSPTRYARSRIAGPTNCFRLEPAADQLAPPRWKIGGDGSYGDRRSRKERDARDARTEREPIEEESKMAASATRASFVLGSPDPAGSGKRPARHAIDRSA